MHMASLCHTKIQNEKLNFSQYLNAYRISSENSVQFKALYKQKNLRQILF